MSLNGISGTNLILRERWHRSQVFKTLLELESKKPNLNQTKNIGCKVLHEGGGEGRVVVTMSPFFLEKVGPVIIVGAVASIRLVYFNSTGPFV